MPYIYIHLCIKVPSINDKLTSTFLQQPRRSICLLHHHHHHHLQYPLSTPGRLPIPQPHDGHHYDSTASTVSSPNPVFMYNRGWQSACVSQGSRLLYADTTTHWPTTTFSTATTTTTIISISSTSSSLLLVYNQPLLLCYRQ